MQSKYRFYFFACIVWFFGTVACSKVPDGVLSEKEMQHVLVDMHLAKIMINDDYSQFRDVRKKKALYASIFEKHHITAAEYDSSLSWYARHLDLYMRVYDGVTAELQRRKKALGDIQPDAVLVLNKDSVNIWNRLDYITLRPDNYSNSVYFDFHPSQPYFSGSQFLLSFNIWGLNKDMRYTPQVRLSLQQQDTTLTVVQNIQQDGLQEMLLKSLPSQKVQRVYGFIRLTNKANTDYYKIYVDSIRLVRYNYGTPVQVAVENTAQALSSGLRRDSSRMATPLQDTTAKRALRIKKKE